MIVDGNEAEAVPDPDAGSALSRTEAHIVRLTFWQTILSVVGVLIAVLALYAALTESAAVRQQTAAAVWPFVQPTVENYDTGEAAGFSLAFTNAGVGPAKVKGVRLVVDGKPMRDWSEVVAGVGGDPGAAVNRNFISDRVLRPDETVVVFSTQDPGLVRKLVPAIGKMSSALTFCYCSIFDACWIADQVSVQQEPEPVDACPDFGDDTYRN
jgi:hypothetical protein